MTRVTLPWCSRLVAVAGVWVVGGELSRVLGGLQPYVALSSAVFTEYGSLRFATLKSSKVHDQVWLQQG